MSYSIVFRTLKKDPNNTRRRYLAHTSVVCINRDGSTYYSNEKDPKRLMFTTMKEAESYVKKNFSRPEHFTLVSGKKANHHKVVPSNDLCMWKRNSVKREVSLESAKRSLAIAVRNRQLELKSESTPSKKTINDYVDRLIAQSESDKAFRAYISNKPKRKETKKDIEKLMPTGITLPPNINTIETSIIIKDKKTGLYLAVPTDGSKICYLTSKENCTVFNNSNDSHYIISNIEQRSFMECYHDMKLIEVDLNDKPIRKLEPVTDHSRYIQAIGGFLKISED